MTFGRLTNYGVSFNEYVLSVYHNSVLPKYNAHLLWVMYIYCCVFHVSVNLSLIGLCSVGHTIYGLASMFIIVEFIATNLISITDGQFTYYRCNVQVFYPNCLF